MMNCRQSTKKNRHPERSEGSPESGPEPYYLEILHCVQDDVSSFCTKTEKHEIIRGMILSWAENAWEDYLYWQAALS